MIFIIFGLLFYIFLYYSLYCNYGFMISNTIMILLKTCVYFLGEPTMNQMKKIPLVKNKLHQLDEYDSKLKMKFITYSFSIIQKHILPIILQIENNKQPVLSQVNEDTFYEKYNSNVFDSKTEELDFLDNLEKLIKTD